jgi:eukaryotic-like serine/threonine-protein kinase
MHLVLGQHVAIKFLLQNATTEVVARFLREARAAVRLKNEHVARVLDVGELPNGAPYMVMEYLDGNDLSQVVRKRGPLPVHEAVEYVLQACEGIAEAHSLGIIHRDLKPANLFLTTGSDGAGKVKVLDFGISKTMEDASEDDEMQLTKTTAVLGSPLYMSPEQLRSARGVTAQSDIWSIGAILHQLLTGQVPFHTTTFTDLILMVNTQSPPPVSASRPDVPPQIDAAILRCLEKSRDARFPNVGELAWAIADFGPPGAHAMAERISRTLEGAGLRVTRPVGYLIHLTSGPMSQQGPMSQRGPLSHSMASSQQGSMASSQQGVMASSQQGSMASSQQGSMASSQSLASSTAATTQSTAGGNQATTVSTRPANRGPLLVAVLVAVVALAGGGVMMGMRSGNPGPASSGEVLNPPPPQTAGTSPVGPVVLPANAEASGSAGSPAPSMSAPSAPTPPGPGTGAAGAKPKTSSSATPKTTAPATAPPPATKGGNPLDIKPDLN